MPVAERSREWFIDIAPDARVRVTRSEAPPPIAYAIMLEVFEGQTWTVIRLWDNADDVDEHHDHRYTRQGGKQLPKVMQFPSPNAAMAAAIQAAKHEWQSTVETWRASK